MQASDVFDFGFIMLVAAVGGLDILDEDITQNQQDYQSSIVESAKANFKPKKLCLWSIISK
jgi:hypothetical protein